MKKIALNRGKLQLHQQRVASLSSYEMTRIQGGDSDSCQQPTTDNNTATCTCPVTEGQYSCACTQQDSCVCPTDGCPPETDRCVSN